MIVYSLMAHVAPKACKVQCNDTLSMCCEAGAIDHLDNVMCTQSLLARPDLHNDVSLDYNRAMPYSKQLGFHVAVDGAVRLPRNLPAAAVFSLAPPGAI